MVKDEPQTRKEIRQQFKARGRGRGKGDGRGRGRGQAAGPGEKRSGGGGEKAWWELASSWQPVGGVKAGGSQIHRCWPFGLAVWRVSFASLT